MYDTIPSNIAIIHNGTTVLLLYPTPNCFILPSLLYRNAGLKYMNKPYKDRNNKIENVLICDKIKNRSISLLYYPNRNYSHMYTIYLLGVIFSEYYVYNFIMFFRILKKDFN